MRMMRKAIGIFPIILESSIGGKGFVTEAMKEVMHFAERELGMKECVTSYAKVNRGSANVLHKLGFVDEAEISLHIIQSL